LIVVLIPSSIILLNNRRKKVIKLNFNSYSNLSIKLKTEDNKIKDIPIEEYVIGVVAGEMPANFNEEALKAQAVASRTYALKRKQNNKKDYDVLDNTNYQVYINEDKMKEKWNNEYETYYKKIKTAVNSTKGEVILYKNNLIDALFFSTSNGYTEDNKDVFEDELPYLISVKSNWDEKESPVFKTQNDFSTEEFLANLGFLDTHKIKIDDINKTKTGRVKTITINDKVFNGRDIRNIFGLRSTSFTINIENNMVHFNVLGYGHGVGMSQYGANGMAKEGYNYKQILKHYYKNCKIKKIN